MLPPGTLRALKGHQDAIVVVVAFALAMSAMVAGAPAGPVVMALGMFHIRCVAKERHDVEMACQRAEQAAVHVEAVKARHRHLTMTEQPEFALQRQQPSAGREGDGQVRP